ncbi:MAG: hypothetical protein ACT4OP_03430 [Actinomycetota bacterium]
MNSVSDVGMPDAEGAIAGRAGRMLMGAAVLGAIVASVLITLAVTGDDRSGGWQTADVGGQGGAEPVLASGGARLLHRNDGLSAEVQVPTPQPATYKYPTGDNTPKWSEPHPPVSPGAADAPEVFTLWLITFNYPSLCTDGECNADDVAPGAAARGGVYQLDGRIADGDTLRFEGNIRLGQAPITGSPLDDPMAAMVHLLIAPHGQALPGADGWRQLNGPVGDISFWWLAEFGPP